MGHCRDCSHYRVAKAPSDLLAAAIGSNDAAVLTAIGKIQEDEKELNAQEQMYRARVEQRGQATWGMRPAMSGYCGQEEVAGVFHIAEIRNRGLECGYFTTTPGPAHDCATCAHRTVPARSSEDVKQEQAYAWMSTGKAAIGQNASMIENLWKEHLQSSANRRANEVRDAYQRKGLLAVQPNYLDYCRHLSGNERFVLCVMQNPYGTCPHWSSQAMVTTTPGTTDSSGLDVGALFALATPHTGIPEEFRARAEGFADFAACILGITFTDTQIAALNQQLREIFEDAAGGRAAAVDAAVAQFAPVKGADVQSRHAWRLRNQPGFVNQLRGRDDALSRLLLQWHTEATMVLAPGTPPLTREAAESWVELIALIPVARSGGEPGNALPPDVESRIAQLAGDYPRLSAQQRSMIALAPITLYELRRAWPAMSASQRAATESQLERQLGVSQAENVPAMAAVTQATAPTAFVAPAAPRDSTTSPMPGETQLAALTRQFAEAQARGDHETAAKLQMQVQIELQNETARREMESNIAKMYHQMSMSIIGNLR